MNSRKRSIWKLIAPLAIFALVASCNRGLPLSLQRDISLEADRLQTAERQVQKSQAALNANLTPADAAPSQAIIDSALSDLKAAELDRHELTQLVERNRPDPRINFALNDEKTRRESALQKVQSVDQTVAKWIDYKHDPAAFAARVEHERATIQTFDLKPVTLTVHKAEQDWPAKKPVLESRLDSLNASAKLADTPGNPSPSALIAEDTALTQQATALATQTQTLQTDCGQLYDSWDKILTDLDRPQFGPDTLYRERVKIIRTHLAQTHSEEHWVNISEVQFHAVENDIGMAIAHKDAGLFDSEALTTPQPPGFSYVASPSVGSNQYGYWSHNGGESVWTFLPQYLILRELLWNHDYHPVMATEYGAYRAAQSRGTTYYGRDTVTAAPKYGTHGTFTQSNYASSRYVQTGGFKGSAYSSGGAPASSPSGLHAADQSAAGRRFGRQPGAAPAGQRFGRSPLSRPSGRGFGRRR